MRAMQIKLTFNGEISEVDNDWQSEQGGEGNSKISTSSNNSSNRKREASNKEREVSNNNSSTQEAVESRKAEFSRGKDEYGPPNAAV